MRHPSFMYCAVSALFVVAGCAEQSAEATVDRAFQDVNVVEETNLTDVMLTVADPNEAVGFFQRSVKEDPDNIESQRGLATSLVRAKRFTEAAPAFAKVTRMEGATNDDRVDHADALIRSGDWAKAEDVLDQVPPTFESYKRYRLEAIAF
ncbi:MAG: tetratricopeptide repeat protein, partial [Pseudomonadota bacterium]